MPFDIIDITCFRLHTFHIMRWTQYGSRAFSPASRWWSANMASLQRYMLLVSPSGFWLFWWAPALFLCFWLVGRATRYHNTSGATSIKRVYVISDINIYARTPQVPYMEKTNILLHYAFAVVALYIIIIDIIDIPLRYCHRTSPTAAIHTLVLFSPMLILEYYRRKIASQPLRIPLQPDVPHI